MRRRSIRDAPCRVQRYDAFDHLPHRRFDPRHVRAIVARDRTGTERRIRAATPTPDHGSLKGTVASGGMGRSLTNGAHPAGAGRMFRTTPATERPFEC
jgi:hypothetical protein